MAKTTCAVDGCDNKRDARGWCAKHYQRWYAHGSVGDDGPRPCCDCASQFAPVNANQKRCSTCRANRKRSGKHRVIGTRTCEWCGEAFDVQTDAPNAKGCSQSCGNKIQWRDNPKPKPEPSGSTIVPWAGCVYCHDWFIARWGRTLCRQVECRRAQSRDRYQQNLDGQPAAATQVMAFYYLAIEQLEIPKASMWRQQFVAYFRTRDGDTCPLCRKHIDFAAKSGPRGSDRGSSIDHIIPRSHGGPDTLANLRLTCWGCNRDRGNRGGGEQLALVG